MSDDVVERMRMAVAEAGYDPSLVQPLPPDEGPFTWFPPLTRRVVWRAREATDVGRPMCWECADRKVEAWTYRRRRLPPCLADRRFVEDCGVERPS